ncbi:MAG: 50S ribosomal protein L17 [Magnetococcales bacterium]|nr:50S ribosomal protein L17 [Magnetococcales bacterium]
MRHRNSGRKLNLTSAHRRSMMSNLVSDLLYHERIETTAPKAKEMRRFVDHMITLGKRGDLHARRQAFSFLQNEEVVFKLFSDIAPRNQERHGGYTRVLKVGFRRGDGAPLSMIELVERTAATG